MPRKDPPYQLEQKCNLMSILNKRHIIPEHSRPFMWDRNEHIEFVTNKLINHCLNVDEQYQYSFGMMIIYTGGSIPAISDAQHRTTICFLILVILSELIGDEEPLSHISQYGGKKSIRTPIIPDEDKAIMDKYGWKRIPNIMSSYEKDFKALGNILNGIPKKKKENQSSKLYAAHKIIKEIIEEKGKTVPDFYINFYNFMVDDICVIKNSISDWDYALTNFHMLNNIKFDVPEYCLLKNAITQIMGIGKSKEIHELFTKFPQDKVNRIMRNILNLYKNEVYSNDDFKTQINTFVTSNQEFDYNKFKSIVEQYENICAKIENNPYGKILMKFCKGGYEIETFCLMPIAYKVNLEKTMEVKLFESLVRMLIAFSIRTFKTVSLNSKTIVDKMGMICTKFLKNENNLKETIDAVRNELIKLIPEENKNNKTFIDILSIQQYVYGKKNFKHVKGMLLYLSKAKTLHEVNIDYNNMHIDHIYPINPDKSIEPLTNKTLINCIGNFTPFAGQNTEGVLVGNSGLGNKGFAIKVPEYKKSSIEMTREIATKYEKTGFADAQIKERSIEIATKLCELTAQDLKLSA